VGLDFRQHVQRLSASHTFDEPVAFQIANLLPSGEGIAQPKFILLSRSSGVTLPAHAPVALKPVVLVTTIHCHAP
jgi:hypothetical protein